MLTCPATMAITTGARAAGLWYGPWLLALLLVVVALPPRVLETDRFVTTDDYPPFSFRGAKHEA